MGIFDIFKEKLKPYKDHSINQIYELLFCDVISLYKNQSERSVSYPWDILFSETASVADLQDIVANNKFESRVKLLAYHKLRTIGQAIDQKILLGVVVEVGLDGGLDVLASFKDGTARYINKTGKIIVWETSDQSSLSLINDLFNNSNNIITKIGPWDKPRRPSPKKDMVRITFLVSDGLYFGEGPISVMFNDPLAGPALASAAAVMEYMIQKGS
jgi:hypothetical protein